MTLHEIRKRVSEQPALQGTLAHDENVASIFEEEDGLETLLETPDYYPHEAQDNIVKMFLQMAEDRVRLLQALDSAEKMIAHTAAQFRETLNRMNQQALDRIPDRLASDDLVRYAAYAAAWDAVGVQFRRVVAEALEVECDGSKDCAALKHIHGCWGQAVDL